MDPVLDSFEQAATKARFAKPCVPFVSTLMGTVIDQSGVLDSTYLREQMRQPVNFMKAVDACMDVALTRSGGCNLLELGPNPVCANLIAQSSHAGAVKVLGSLNQRRGDWDSINTIVAEAYLAGLPVDWSAIYEDDMPSVRLVNLPHYRFDLENFWHSYQHQPATCTVRKKNAAGSAESAIGYKHLPYTSLQYVEAMDIKAGTAIFGSKPTESNLLRAIHGHEVDGVAICPASVFIDMALTAAAYLLNEAGVAATTSQLELVDGNFVHPLVMHEPLDSSQLVRVSAKIQEASTSVAISFSSNDRNGHREHGSCLIRVHPSLESRLADWTKIESLVKNQARCLQRDAREAVAHRISTALVYKLFSPVVEYSDAYQGIQEVWVAKDFRQATASLDLGNTVGPGYFTRNPYAVDAMVHLAGFLLNADPAKPPREIYIAHRIGSFHVLQDPATLAAKGLCTSVAAIRDASTKMKDVVCDIYIFSDHGLIAICNGVHFQKMKRETFSYIVGMSAASTAMPLGHKDVINDAATPTRRDNRDRQSISEPVSGCNLPDVLHRTIASHTGIDPSAIAPTSNVADMGIDSLMTISISRDFEKLTAVKLPAGFFNSVVTMEEAVKGLNDMSASRERPTREHGQPPLRKLAPLCTELPTKSVDTCHQSQPTILSSTCEFNGSSETSSADDSVRRRPRDSALEIANADTHGMADEADASLSTDIEKATSRAVLIHGYAQDSGRPLFLITDGSGSVSGYFHLPPLPNGRRLYALESPFVDQPNKYTLTVREMAQVFVKAVRKEQPHGPYLIGGWSAGSIYAYEVCYQLSQQGEAINGLVLIDMPLFRPVADAHEITPELLERAGMFTGVKRSRSVLRPNVTHRQKLHIVRTVRALARYVPKPFPPGQEPLCTHLIWADRGVSEKEQEEDGMEEPACLGGRDSSSAEEEHAAAAPPMTGAEFATFLRSCLAAKRVHLSTDGWEQYVGRNIRVATVEGDHFSMVTPPAVKQLGIVILEAVAIDAENLSTKMMDLRCYIEGVFTPF